MSDNETDDIAKFYFSFEQVVSKRQTGTYRIVKHPVWEPPTTVYEASSILYVRVEIAGMRDQKVHISLDENQLVISGQRPMQNTEEDVQVFHRLEIPYGEFRVVVKLPYRVVAEKARARYKDGFLDIELPRQNN